MIVTDFVNADSLDDPDILQSLSEDDVPQILSQAMRAVEFAHRQGLSHGTLSEKDLYWLGDSTLNVQNTLMSYLVFNLAEDNLANLSKSEEDFFALNRIATRLVKRLVRTPEIKQQIEKVMKKAIDGEWSLSDAASELVKLPTNILPPLQEQVDRPNAVGVPAVNSTDRRPRQEFKNSNVHPDDEVYPIEREKKHRRQKTLRRASQIATVILAIAAVYFMSTAGWFGGNTSNSAANLSETVDDAGETLPVLLRQDPSQVVAVTPTSSNTNEESEASTIAGNFTDDQISKRPNELEDLPDIGTTNETKTQLSDETEFPGGIQAQDDQSTPNTTDAPDSGDSLLDQFKSIMKEDGIEAHVSENPKLESTGKETAATGSLESAANEETGHAVNLPEHMSLPTADDKSPLEFGEISTDQSLDLVLISDSDALPKNTNFKLSGSQNSGWSVSFAGQDSNQQIANINVANDRLVFQWTENASKVENAGHLANCILKTTVDLKASYISLRKPALIENFVFKRDKPHLKIVVPNLEYLPRTAYAQLQSFDEEEFGELYFKGDSEERKFSRKNLLEVHFSDLEEYQMLFLLLSSDLKKKARLEVALRLQIPPENRARTANEKSINTATQILQNFVTDVKNRHDFLKDNPIAEIRERLNLSSDVYKDAQRDKEVKELAKRLEFHEARFKEFREAQSKLEKFFSEPVPVSICFDLQGQQVVIASSVPKSVD